jgi:hypothetical protein
VSTDRDGYGASFWSAFAVGWVVMGFGVVQLFASKDGAGDALRIVTWVAGGHAVHDAVVVPIALAIGAGVSALAAPRLRAPIRAGLLGTAFIFAVAYPALRGFGRKPSNPSLLPLDYGTAVLTATAIVWAAVLVWGLVITSLRRPRGAAAKPPRPPRRGRRAAGTHRS